jgi:hypothetical protein
MKRRPSSECLKCILVPKYTVIRVIGHMRMEVDTSWLFGPWPGVSPVSVEECRSVYGECGNGDTVGSARALKPLRRRVACFVSRITTAIVKLSGV